MITNFLFRFRPAKLDGSEGTDGSQGSQTGAPQDAATAQQQQHQQFLGDASSAIPNFGEVDVTTVPLPDGITVEHIKTFEKMYREHAEVCV